MVKRIKRKIEIKQKKVLALKEKLIKIPVLGALHDIGVSYHEQRVTGLAAESAYYIILAFFPFIIFLVSILGLIGRRTAMASQLIAELNGLVPEPLLSLIQSFLIETVLSSNITLASFSMLGVLWASSNGFTVLLRGLDRAYDGQVHSFLFLRSIGLLFTFLLGLGILLTLLLVTFGGVLLSQLEQYTDFAIFTGSFIQWIRFIGSFVLLFLVFTILYIIVAKPRKRLFQALPGALFSTLSWVGLSLGFSWYINNFDRYARLYGSIAGLIILLVWIYLCCNVLLLGGIINAVIYHRRQDRRRKKQEIDQVPSPNFQD